MHITLPNVVMHSDNSVKEEVPKNLREKLDSFFGIHLVDVSPYTIIHANQLYKIRLSIRTKEKTKLCHDLTYFGRLNHHTIGKFFRFFSVG